WVCPLIEESETLECISAEERFASLSCVFSSQELVLLHGKMHSRERLENMQRFISGEARIMVATTVIEVGVDIPSAEVMVIEHSERFGLAQLHQLRGRIGRGTTGGHCILLYHNHLSQTQRARLDIMRQHDDGFYIAEEDLRLRGSGEILGTRQSGLPHFHFADFSIHKNLLQMAHEDAVLLMQKDPKLKSPRGQALRYLLYLFSRERAIALLDSG
ncbi:MAG: helicase-related protein, partial [Pseudomonadota bacterium]